MDPMLYELAVTLRHELHSHPEVSNQEVWTKAHLMSFLREHTNLKVVDRGKWFYVVYHTSPDKPKIAFRADFYELPIDEAISLPYGSVIPGVSHKCGHDGHSATLAAFAIEVDRRGADNNIYFIFQHAEETGDGAKECAVLIAEEGIDEVYGYHNEPGRPLGEVIVRHGSFQCASKGMSMFSLPARPLTRAIPGWGGIRPLQSPGWSARYRVCIDPRIIRGWFFARSSTSKSASRLSVLPPATACCA